MTLILGQQNRGMTRNIVITNVDRDTITPGANDFVRVRIGREGQTDVFTVTSGTPTAAGSRITTGATNVLRIDADDLGFSPGTYTLFVDFFDSADLDEWKEVDRQDFVLEAV
jgi:hypothetical protein